MQWQSLTIYLYWLLYDVVKLSYSAAFFQIQLDKLTLYTGSSFAINNDVTDNNIISSEPK